MWAAGWTLSLCLARKILIQLFDEFEEDLFDVEVIYKVLMTLCPFAQHSYQWTNDTSCCKKIEK